MHHRFVRVSAKKTGGIGGVCFVQCWGAKCLDNNVAPLWHSKTASLQAQSYKRLVRLRWRPHRWFVGAPTRLALVLAQASQHQGDIKLPTDLFANKLLQSDAEINIFSAVRGKSCPLRHGDRNYTGPLSPVSCVTLCLATLFKSVPTKIFDNKRNPTSPRSLIFYDCAWRLAPLQIPEAYIALLKTKLSEENFGALFQNTAFFQGSYLTFFRNAVPN